MTELADFLTAQPMLALFATIALGTWPVRSVFAASRWARGPCCSWRWPSATFAPGAAMPSSMGALGLLLFLYGVGLAYGKQFFDGLTSPLGLKANAASVIGVLIMAVMTVASIWLFPDASLPETLGVFAGAAPAPPRCRRPWR